MLGCIAEGVAQQIESRVMFRRAMKKAVQSAPTSWSIGIKISVSGRLGGSDIARSECIEKVVFLFTLFVQILIML